MAGCGGAGPSCGLEWSAVSSFQGSQIISRGAKRESIKYDRKYCTLLVQSVRAPFLDYALTAVLEWSSGVPSFRNRFHLREEQLPTWEMVAERYQFLRILMSSRTPAASINPAASFHFPLERTSRWSELTNWPWTTRFDLPSIFRRIVKTRRARSKLTTGPKFSYCVVHRMCGLCGALYPVNDQTARVKHDNFLVTLLKKFARTIKVLVPVPDHFNRSKSKDELSSCVQRCGWVWARVCIVRSKLDGP